MVNLKIIAVVFSLCVVQLTNTNLTKIIVTLLNMLSFLLPLRVISESYNIVYLFSLDRLLVTYVIFIVYFAPIFAWFLNFKTSFLNIKLERLNIRRPVQEMPYEILSHDIILSHCNREFRESFKKRLCFFRSVLPSPSTPIFWAICCQLKP